MLAKLKWTTREAIQQWKGYDSTIITNEVRAIFIKRARLRLVTAYRKMQQLYPTHNMVQPRLKQLRSEDIRGMIAEYKHFLQTANSMEVVPTPITEAVVASILQARLPRSHSTV